MVTKLTEATPRNVEVYALSNFLNTLWKLQIVDDIEARFALFFRGKRSWERGYDEL